jgi:hypothetical protein
VKDEKLRFNLRSNERGGFLLRARLNGNGNTMVTIETLNNNVYVDVRDFFFVKKTGDLVPTKDGIMMSKADWERLRKANDQVDAVMEKVNQVVQESNETPATRTPPSRLQSAVYDIDQFECSSKDAIITVSMPVVYNRYTRSDGVQKTVSSEMVTIKKTKLENADHRTISLSLSKWIQLISNDVIDSM